MDEIQALRDKYGIKPVTVNPEITSDRLTRFRNALLDKQDPNMIKIGNTPIVGGIVGGPLKTIGDAAKEGWNKAVNAETASGVTKNPFKAGTEIASGLASIATSPLAPVMKPIMDRSINMNDSAVKLLENNPQFQEFAKSKLGTWLDDTYQKFAMSKAGQVISDVAEITGDLANTAGAVAGVEGAIKGAPELLKTVKNTPETIINKADEVTNKFRASSEATATIQSANELQKIKEMITPKPTIKQAKLATEQGRLYEGKSGTFFKEGTPTRVSPTDLETRSIFTIQKNIPGASMMDKSTLYQALDEHVSSTAKKLQPQMETVPLKPETIQRISTEMKNLRKTQIAEAKATDELNVSKWQSNFKKIVDKHIKKGEGNLNDVWNAAKDYDASIKSNVKTATELSPEDLQIQKDIWLENRAILRGILKDDANGLGSTARQAFSDMTDMYEAQNGILSKAKIEKVGEPSSINKFIEKHKKPLKVGGLMITGAGAGEVIRRATGL